MNALDDRTRSLLLWAAAWTAVYAVNLPLPVAFGHDVTRNGGQVSMYATTWAMWAVGLVVGGHFKGLRWPVCVGGVATAMSQVFVVVHMFVGGVALGVGDDLAGSLAPAGSPASAELKAVSATLITGYTFIGFALLCGITLRAISRWLDPPLDRHADGSNP